MDGLLLDITQEKIDWELLRATLGSVNSPSHHSITINRQPEASISFISYELVLPLSGSPAAVIDDMLSVKPNKVIISHRQLGNIDQLNNNTFRQSKDAEVGFKRV